MDRAALERAHRMGRNLTATIDDQSLLLTPKVFKTGSLGWHGQGKVAIDDTRCQLSIVVTVIGSKTQPVQDTPSKAGVELNNGPLTEQVGNAPEKAPEAPPGDSPLFPDDTTPKRSRKR